MRLTGAHNAAALQEGQDSAAFQQTWHRQLQDLLRKLPIAKLMKAHVDDADALACLPREHLGQRCI